jgi:hypothetical protein
MGTEFQQPINGTITAVSQNIDLTSPNSGTEIVQITGTWVGTLIIEGSNDGTTYYAIDATNRATRLLVTSITANGSFQANTNGFQFIRIRSSAWTSGTANISVYGSDSTSLISTDSLLRGGSDGTVIGNDGDALKVVNVDPIDTVGLDVKYSEVSSVVSGVETNVISFTAAGSGYRVSKIYVAGENIALFKIKVNGTTILAKRTFFGNLNEEFNFENFSNGLKLQPLDQVVVTVLHTRPWSGNFESSIIGLNL